MGGRRPRAVADGARPRVPLRAAARLAKGQVPKRRVLLHGGPEPGRPEAHQNHEAAAVRQRRRAAEGRRLDGAGRARRMEGEKPRVRFFHVEARRRGRERVPDACTLLQRNSTVHAISKVNFRHRESLGALVPAAA